MSRVATPYRVVLDPKAYEGIRLLETDGEPMDTIWHRDCMFLLIEVTAHHFRDHPDYFVGGNNFIYFNPDQARNLDYRGPDFFFIKDGVDRSRERQYWALWEENGRVPDVVIELLSPTTRREDRTTKFTIYEQTLCVPEYFLYDPETQELEGYRLQQGRYQQLTPNERGWLWSEEMQLWLGTWVGEYLGTRATYLRFYTCEGQLALLPSEEEHLRAEEERRRAEEERRRADDAARRADDAARQAETEKKRADEAERELARLRALLKQQGQTPQTPGEAAP